MCDQLENGKTWERLVLETGISKFCKNLSDR